MKTKHITLITICLILLSCNRITQGQIYREEKLLFSYLDKFHAGEMADHVDFNLFLYRTNNICKSCREIPLDSVFELAMQESKDKILYVLTDNPEDANILKKKYPTEIHCICGEPKTMDRYGFPKMEPLLFEIKNRKVIAVKNWYKH